MTAAFSIALPPNPNARLAVTHTCDEQGNWRKETRWLLKDASGWHDIPLIQNAIAQKDSKE